jgi:hypothetical protein
MTGPRRPCQAGRVEHGPDAPEGKPEPYQAAVMGNADDPMSQTAEGSDVPAI